MVFLLALIVGNVTNERGGSLWPAFPVRICGMNAHRNVHVVIIARIEQLFDCFYSKYC